MVGAVLGRDAIIEMVNGPSRLIENYVSLESQLQPNGFDLSLHEVSRLTMPGQMGAENADRLLPNTEPLEFDGSGWVTLPPGPHLITFNEVVNIPLGLMALGYPRSSLLRSGVSIHTAVWDAGYSGRSQSLLVVYHPLGYRIQHNARLLQLVFHHLESMTSEGYQGRFWGEGDFLRPSEGTQGQFWRDAG